jgi:cell division protein ZapA (FtsZ GTPase activity inhibitor)
MLYLLESQVNRILQQSKVTYVKIENGQILAQPIQNTEINLALVNIQKTINSIVNNIDRYAKRIYNENPINTTDDLKNNLSLNKIIDFINTVLSIYLVALQIQIKIRKSQDIAAAANALATVPPQPLVAARYTQASLELTANEQKKLNDLVAAYFQIKNIDDQITFYGKKYIKQKARLSDLKGTIDSFITSTTNKTLTQLNNQITGSLNQLTGSLDKKLNT